MIRNMNNDDKAVFFEMMKDFYSSKAVTHNIDASVMEATFNAAINEPHLLRGFIIEDSGTPAGFALISFCYATEVGGLAVLLEDIYLSKACRGKGLGSKFIGYIEKEYPKAKRFYLEVTKENTRAIDLYKKHGYEIHEYVQMAKNI